MNPDPTPDGRRLIFSTNRKAASREQVQAWRGTIRQTGSGDYDLWIATIADTAPSPTFTNVSEIRGINTDSVEGASAMSPAGDFLYFASNRPGGRQVRPLPRRRSSAKTSAHRKPRARGINTPENETDPALAMGGFRLYFSSDRANHEGLYTLLSSDSREVYAHRQNPGLPPRLERWSLLLSALLLVPLILALRARPGRLGTLQRCLVASLLIHALLTLVFSFVLVTQDVTHYVKRQIAGGGDIALNLNLPKDVEIGLAVRSQYSSDIPLNTAEPTSVSRTIANTPPERPTLPNGKSDAAAPRDRQIRERGGTSHPKQTARPPPSATPVNPKRSPPPPRSKARRCHRTWRK